MLPSVLLIKLKTEQCVYLVYMSVTVHQLLLLRLITRAGQFMQLDPLVLLLGF